MREVRRGGGGRVPAARVRNRHCEVRASGRRRGEGDVGEGGEVLVLREGKWVEWCGGWAMVGLV